jgi:monoamine oxidase
MNEHLTRRQLLTMVGAVGGATAIYKTSRALGLMEDSGAAARLDLKQVPNGSRKVVVLGAGVSGLAVAYELERSGYDVTVLEASHRIGGRNLTIRGGDIVDEMGNQQVCRFDDDPELYMNAGPARLPGHHRRVMHYCKTLNVPLIIKGNFTRNAYTHDENHFDGKPVRVGHYVADARGFLSELLYKSIDQNRYDQPLSPEDRERLMQFATSFGDLTDDGTYKGSMRAGYDEGGFLKPGQHRDPIPFDELLNSTWWARGMTSSENPDWGEPLMEVAGGMDNIVKAFVENIDSSITTNAQVQSIQLQEQGIDVVYNHEGKREKISADYCFNCIPAHFMSGIPNNLPTEYREGLAAMKPGNFFKLGLQMNKRFWEDEGIYGGSTSTTQKINTIWYPSHGIHGKKGVVLGTYAFFDQVKFWDRMSPDERISYAAKCGDNIHEGYSGYVDSGVSVPWGRMNHMMGCGTRWTPDVRDKYYKLLQQPAGGRHFMMGDQISYHSSWQEGAFASAENAMLELDQRVRAESSQSGAS